MGCLGTLYIETTMYMVISSIIIYSKVILQIMRSLQAFESPGLEGVCAPDQGTVSRWRSQKQTLNINADPLNRSVTKGEIHQ